jgi:hypothetical protein
MSAPPDVESNGEVARKTRRSSIFVELGWLILLIWIYNWLQDLAPLRSKLAFANARSVFSFEKSIGLDPEAALDHWLAHQHVLAYVTSNFYAVAIFGATFGFAAWTWWNRPDIYRPLRNYIVLANLIAFAVFAAFPVAPPRMLAGFVDVVAKSGGLGWHNSLVRHADQLAAMPSMHVGYAVWCSVVAWRLAHTRAQKVWALVFGISYPLLTAWAVMATANHYLVDVLAGAATTAVSIVLVDAAAYGLRRLRSGVINLDAVRPTAVPSYAARGRHQPGEGVVARATNHLSGSERGTTDSQPWVGSQRASSTANLPSATADLSVERH